MVSFDSWVANQTGRWDDRDGWYGAQCWDEFAAYCIDQLGAPGVAACTTARSGRFAGFAGSLYTGYPVTTWQGQAFDRIPAGNPAKKGDVAIWDADANHPSTHVAIVLRDAPAGRNIYVLAQNAGPGTMQNGRQMWETPASLGYLRPKTNNNGTGNGVRKDKTMRAIIQIDDESALRYFDGTKLHLLTHADQVTALQMASRLAGCGDIPCFKLGSKAAPWGQRLAEALR